MYSHRTTRSQLVIPVVALTLLALLATFLSPAPVAAASCQFVFGFKSLHDRIPTVVGDCVSNEAYATNGDGLQRTTNGLLVWRKADNHTAFTNGANTWVLGPQGLQERPNNSRFAWEPDVAPSDVDPRLSASYQLAAHSQFSGLVSALAKGQVLVGVSDLNGAWGVFGFNGGHPVIYISPALLNTDPNDAAAVIVHEATHFQQFQTQPDFTHASSTQCLNDELQATANDLLYWQDRYGPDGKQPPANAFERQVNYQLGLAERDLRSLLLQTAIDYRQECG
ncbi:MAG TPA: hypothetical protein VFZ25_13905 [Chloroflexota bacterium]|nr:hypothetical protein [Chloroflexota bacterium]